MSASFLKKHLRPPNPVNKNNTLSTGSTSTPQCHHHHHLPTHGFALAFFLIHASPALCQKNVTTPLEQCQHRHCLVWECKKRQPPRAHRGGATRWHWLRTKWHACGQMPKGLGDLPLASGEEEVGRRNERERKRSLRRKGLNSSGIRLGLPSYEVMGFLAMWAWGKGWRTGGGDCTERD